jgi:hypothetical protein
MTYFKLLHKNTNNLAVVKIEYHVETHGVRLLN